ncbi:M16 family metallopeptidase [Bacteroidota bacterium]
MDYQVYTLENGIRLVHMDDRSDVAWSGVFVNTGSRDENKHEHGMAHFIEHILFKGTKKRRAYHILSRLENVGGEINAFTTKEETCIYAAFLNEYYDRTLELFSDILNNSIFPDKELIREKEVIIDEINSFKDNPSELIFDDFEDQIFKGHPIGQNILGTAKSIKKFGKKEIEAFMKRNYNTDQMVICSVGNIKFNKLVKLFRKYFEPIPTNLRTFERKTNYSYNSSNVIQKKDTNQAHCIIGNLGYDISNKKRLGLLLLNDILGGYGMNSRLNMSLREKHGYAYNVESNYTPYLDSGILNIYFGTDRGNINKSFSLVNSELNKLMTKKLGTLQLKKAKAQLMGQIAISKESKESQLLSIGKSFLHFNRMDSLLEINRKIELIGSAELLDIANEIFNPENISSLIYK